MNVCAGLESAVECCSLPTVTMDLILRNKIVMGVLLVVCMGLIFICGFVVGRESTVAPLISCEESTVAPTILSQVSSGEYNDIKEWEKNKDSLLALGCQPKPTTVNVKENIHKSRVSLPDTLYPSHLVVMRCVSNSSFCGSGNNKHWGYTDQKISGALCLSTNTTQEKFEVMYMGSEGKQETTVEVDVHHACACKVDD